MRWGGACPARLSLGTICGGRPKGRPYRDKQGVESTRPFGLVA
jgi:hypothetical protein